MYLNCFATKYSAIYGDADVLENGIQIIDRTKTIALLVKNGHMGMREEWQGGTETKSKVIINSQFSSVQ